MRCERRGGGDIGDGVMVMVVVIPEWRLNYSPVVHMTSSGPSTLRKSEKKLVAKGVAAVGVEVITLRAFVQGPERKQGREGNSRVKSGGGARWVGERKKKGQR